MKNLLILSALFFISCKEKLYRIEIETFYKGKQRSGTYLRDMERLSKFVDGTYSAKRDSTFNPNLYDSITVKIFEQ